MAIERSNSFHLMLSDNELALLKLLAERDGLNPSDYLRTVLRREADGASGAVPLAHVRQLLQLLGGDEAVARGWAGQQVLLDSGRGTTKVPKRRAAMKKKRAR